MWLAELAFLDRQDQLSRSAQFVIRTAVRAQALAELAGTNPIDELLDGRAQVTGAAARAAFEGALTYVRRDQELSAAIRPARFGITIRP
ncbi:MAG: hypothetical protein JWN95_1664 [Frankiales bacterium]|nr:hypothetical protein [Frankiales bacterium]